MFYLFPAHSLTYAFVATAGKSLSKTSYACRFLKVLTTILNSKDFHSYLDYGQDFHGYCFRISLVLLIGVEILQLTKHLKALKIMDSWSLRKGGEKG